MAGESDWDWDIKYQSNLVHIINNLKVKGDIQDEKLVANIACQSKFDVNGDILEHDCDTDLDKYGFDKEEEQEIVDLWAYGTTTQLTLNSKPLVAGDVFRYHDLEDIMDDEFEIGIPEIVKGTAMYKGRKSVVTELKLDEIFYEQDIKLNVRCKGYVVYDIDSSILLSRKESYYMIISIPGHRKYDTFIYGNSNIDINSLNVQ